jgi:hypothetical protein
MIDAIQLNETVYILLHESRSARKGADVAREAGDVAWETKLRQKARAKEREANETDPAHVCPAWQDHLRGTAT